MKGNGSRRERHRSLGHQLVRLAVIDRFRVTANTRDTLWFNSLRFDPIDAVILTAFDTASWMCKVGSTAFSFGFSPSRRTQEVRGPTDPFVSFIFLPEREVRRNEFYRSFHALSGNNGCFAWLRPTLIVSRHCEKFVLLRKGPLNAPSSSVEISS